MKVLLINGSPHAKVSARRGGNTATFDELLESLLAQSVDYKIVEGNGSSIREDADVTLRFKANGAFSKFTGVKVDNNLIDTQYYTAESGSTIITLKNVFLDKLSVGTHSITVMYTDGKASGSFTIKAKPSSPSSGEDSEGSEGTSTENKGGTASEVVSDTQVKDAPPMGDEANISLYIAALLLASIGLILTTVISRRKRN